MKSQRGIDLLYSGDDAIFQQGLHTLVVNNHHNLHSGVSSPFFANDDIHREYIRTHVATSVHR